MKARETKRVGKRALVALLVLALSVMMVPSIAFAADDTDKKVAADARTQDYSGEFGNITPKYGDVCIDADADAGHTATVKAENCTTVENAAITADATNLGSINIDVNNVTSKQDDGVEARVDGDGSIKITTGDISSGEQGAGIWTSVDNRNALTPASPITVKAGDVNAEGEGIVIRPYANTTITIEAGDVTAKGDGVQVVAESGGNAVVKANDISSGKSGMFVYVSNGSTLDALVTGTLSGTKAPISFFGALFNNQDAFKLTVWKIALNNGAAIMMAENADSGLGTQAVSDSDANGNNGERLNMDLTYASTEGSSNFEKTIRYIMKLTQPDAGATLFATDANGKALEQSHGYSVAKEGDKVLLKVNLEDGYKLLAAYDGNGDKVELVKGDDGNYYIAYTVPKGGGLGLSVLLDNLLAMDSGSTDEPSATGAATTKATSAASSGATLANTGDSLPVLPVVGMLLIAVAAAYIARKKLGSMAR